MSDLLTATRALCAEYGFWQVLDALANLAHLYAVDAALSQNDRLRHSWTATTKALSTTSQLYRGGR
jgi:hypothetical protein